MKPTFEQLSLAPEQSFGITELDLPAFDAPWHFHPEYELTFIKEGCGTRFVGDHIERYTSGDCVLLGPNLPHHWRSTRDATPRSRATVIQFTERAVPTVPELSRVARLLEDSKRGVYFPDVSSIEFDGTYLGFLSLLERLATQNDGQSLTENPDPKTSQRLTRACDYIFQHFAERITLEEVATAASMSPAAFSRYFKKHSGKPLTHFIAEHRVAEAARQLIETHRGVSEIAFDTGFGSLSAFNRHFREFRSVSPREFRKRYR